MPKRLRKLSDKPYRYIRKPDQPRNNFRDLIYALDIRGADEIREVGNAVGRPSNRALPHELMACIIAASFEYGAKDTDANIDFEFKLPELGLRPDWRPFRLTNPQQQAIVFIEADTGSEAI